MRAVDETGEGAMTEQAAAGGAVSAAGTTGARHRVVVIGGGFGGLNAVRALATADADVTVVDRTNHHLFQPLLYQVAAGILPPGLIAPALRSIIKNQANAHAVLAEVTKIDLANKEISTEAPTDARSRWATTRWWSRPGRRTPTSAATSSRSSPPA